MTRRASRRLADSITRASLRTGRADPATRGADWQTATVDTVNTDGTVTTTSGITARRTEAYQAPAPGDVIHVSQSGSRNWRAEGRAAGATAPNGAWTNLPLASGFTTPQTNLQVAQYRLINAWGTPRVELRGSVKAPGTGVASETAFTSTLPAEIVPQFIRSFIVRRVYNGSTLGVIPVEVLFSTKTMNVFGTTGTETTWFGLDGCSYDL